MATDHLPDTVNGHDRCTMTVFCRFCADAAEAGRQLDQRYALVTPGNDFAHLTRRLSRIGATGSMTSSSSTARSAKTLERDVVPDRLRPAAETEAARRLAN